MMPQNVFAARAGMMPQMPVQMMGQPDMQQPQPPMGGMPRPMPPGGIMPPGGMMPVRAPMPVQGQPMPQQPVTGQMPPQMPANALRMRMGMR